ncbi:CoA transferase [Mesorhizobium sp. M1406]|uniref:CoA transferase n=1 Tax=Mesorhizobium sp. M1406 TaxID=2957099 RepID=UPI00333BDEA1
MERQARREPLDSGAPFYDTYETSDGRHIAIGCLEPQFFAEFARLLPLDERFVSGQYDKALWPPMRAAIADRVRRKSRDDWDLLFTQTDACVAPVLSLHEAKQHPHNRARNSFVMAGALERPAPAPRSPARGRHRRPGSPTTISPRRRCWHVSGFRKTRSTTLSNPVCLTDNWRKKIHLLR